MNNIARVKDCADCGCCSAVCPQGAICVDESGFFYRPVVDEKKCVDCGLCLARCPVEHAPKAAAPIAAYGGWSVDGELVLSSSSGGIFGELAQKIIAEGGAVFGAAYAEDRRTVVMRSSDEIPLSQLRKSKYVESLTGDAFQKIREALGQGRKVLFCGTPCQAAGLKNYLSGDDEGLLLCDFACGGFPSHEVFRAYLKRLETAFRSEIDAVDFRPKTHGWNRHAIRVRFKNGKVYNQLGTEDDYMRAFLYGKLTVRDNCLRCRFSDHHAADITLADFWLYQRYSSLENPDGISLVLCNTEKGLQALRSIADRSQLAGLDLADASYNNRETALSGDVIRRHDAFIGMCREQSFDVACQRLMPRSAKSVLKNRAARILFKKRK